MGFKVWSEHLVPAYTIGRVPDHVYQTLNNGEYKKLALYLGDRLKVGNRHEWKGRNRQD